MVQKTFNTIKTHWPLVSLVLAYIFIFGFMACMRHYTFQTQTWDLAAFEQSFWNTVHGHFMFNTFEGKSHFAIHFSPFLILLVPLYAIWQSPYTLLLLQTIALALGAIPLYALARKKIGQRLALFIVIGYLFYPSLGWINLYDFHAVPFAIPFILSALYFIEFNNYKVANIFLLLTAAVEENMIIAVLFIGVYILFFKNRRWGSAMVVASTLYFILVAKIFMPAFGGGIVRLDRYAQFGTTISDIIYHIISHPQLVIQTVATEPKMMYLLKLFISVAFLPLLVPSTFILLLPGLLQNLLTNFEFQYQNFYQYDSIIIPFLWYGIIFGIRKIVDKKYKLSLPVATPVVVGLLVFGFFWNSPLSPQNFPWARFNDSKVETLNKILGLIPPNASVAAHTNLVPHLTHRENVYMTGDEPFLVDIVVFDSTDLFGFPDEATFNEYLDAYRQNGNYSLVIINERYYMLTRFTKS